MQTETNRIGEFIGSEANGTRSREVVTILSGETVTGGAVLGKVTASGKYVPLDPGASDGSEAAAAIAYEDCDASAADTDVTVIVRDAEVKTDALVWASGVTAPQQATAIAELAALGIIAR
jgi:hypothetical protein